MESIELRLTGKSSLLMHSGRLANPLDPAAKELKKLSTSRDKTDETHEAMARVEWFGGIYHDPKIGPYIPTENVRSAVIGGAKLHRDGSKVKRAVLVLEDRAKLEYKGPRDLEELFADPAHVDVRRAVLSKTKSVRRCRPVFPEWSVTVRLHYLPEVINRADLIRAAEQAGQMIGIGDFRPERGGQYGRFDVEVVG